MTVRTVAAGETSFLLRDHGSGGGVPVLLLHGVPETSSCWRDLAPRLAEGRRVLAPDLPGLGGSSYSGPYDVPSLVAQLVALITDETSGGPVDVVGHDWGGSLALALAGARPDLVRRLAVANAPYRQVPVRALHIPLFALPVAPELLFRLGGRRAVRLMLGLGWRADTPLDPETQAEYESAYAQADRVRAMLGYYRAAARPRLAALLSRARPSGTPRVHAERMLVLWGARDPVLPVSTGESVVSDLGPDCTMVTIPGAGHFVIEEAPEVVADVLVDFLSDGVDGAAPPEGPLEPRVEETDPPEVEDVPTVGLVPVAQAPARSTAGTRKPVAAKAPAAEKAPVKKAPVKQAPAKRAPATQAPVKQTPTKKAAAEQGPVKQTPARKSAVKKAAAGQAPVKKAVAPETAAGKPSTPRKGPAGAQQPGSPAARRSPRRPAGGAGPEVPPSPSRG